jgi:hypothetical protein
MLLIMVFGCILVAGLATAGLIASAQNAQDEANEIFSVSQGEIG